MQWTNSHFVEERERERVRTSGEWRPPSRRGPTIINRAWRLSFGYLWSFYNSTLVPLSYLAKTNYVVQHKKFPSKNSTLVSKNIKCLPSEAIWGVQFRDSIGHRCKSLLINAHFLGKEVFSWSTLWEQAWVKGFELLHGIFLLLDQSLDSDSLHQIGGYYLGRSFYLLERAQKLLDQVLYRGLEKWSRQR